MTEQELKKLILDYLLTKGHYCWVNNSGMTINTYTNKSGFTKKRIWRAGIRGSSDIIGIEKGTGRFIAIECKVGKNHTTAVQDIFLDEIKSRGGYAFTAYSLEDVRRYL